MGRYRTDLTFRRITPEESRIYQDGAIVGEVYRQEDILHAGAHYYVIHLSEDHRGPSRCTTARASAPRPSASWTRIRYPDVRITDVIPISS